ncbi:DUF4192 domain-containing protein [Psychromicrobium lacuslunae]|uniref:DUF4192 domain-containing protein n=1 Tax=Psychromicrobium lacuslunae TaxID=1618207 RepID=A0A0D4BXA7_9MICC|nr:DUF4192 domain-containing protein [Psychromicrobium lacuslunae]AJT40760.1 hypothetical protein UM93_03100 [Psychromicrobium lacuslunae]
MTAQTPLTIAEPAELLAYLPHALGYFPERSLMVVGLRGKTIGGTVRVDLPDVNSSLEQCREFSETVAECLAVDRLADASVLALFTGVDWLDGEDPGFDRLMLCLREALQLRGKPVCQAWWLGERYFRNYLCRDERCCPSPGVLLSKLKSSRLNTELVFRGSSYFSDLSEATQAPTLSRVEQLAMYRGFSRNMLRLGEAMARQPLEHTLSDWSAEMRRLGRARTAAWGGNRAAGGEAQPWERWGGLMAILQCPRFRDAVLLLALCDAAPDQKVEIADLLLGNTDFRPPWRTLNGLRQLLRLMSAMHDFVPVLEGWGAKEDGVSEPERPQLATEQFATELQQAVAASYSLLGWIEWSRGRGSRAGAYLEAALEVLPGYRLAELLTEVLGSGLLCKWAKSAATAWQRSASEAD